MSALFEEAPGVWKVTNARLAQLQTKLDFLESGTAPFHVPDSFEQSFVSVRDSRLSFAAEKREWAKQTPGYLSVRAYAADKLVLGCGFQLTTPQPFKRWSSYRPRVARGATTLARPRETQKIYSILGRERGIPSKTRFTSYLSNQIRDGGTVIERLPGGKGFFATLTWPGSLQEGFDVASAGSGAIINRLNQWLRPRVLRGYFCYVWELQERGAPHLHYMFRTPSSISQKDFREQLRAEWRNILLDVSDTSGVDLFARDAKRTWRRSATKPIVYLKRLHEEHAGYMAKYASKSRSKSGSACNWHPGRWGALSYPLLQEVRRHRLDFKVSTFSGKSAAVKMSRLVSLLERVCKPAVVYRGFETFGASVASLDTPKGRAKEFALAIASVIARGDWSEAALLAVLDKLS